MLKSQPVHCQTVRHSQTSLTHSPIHSLFLFIPSFLPSLSVFLISPRASKWGPPLSLRCLQTEGEAKVCNSSKLFVKREGKICSVGGLVASYSCRDSLFRNLISPFVSPQKTWFNKVRALQQPGCRNFKPLLRDNANHVTLPKRTISLWFQ